MGWLCTRVVGLGVLVGGVTVVVGVVVGFAYWLCLAYYVIV